MARSGWARAVAAAAVVATAAWGTAGATAAPPEGIDHEVALSEAAKTGEWTGTTSVGANVTHFDATLGEQCGDTPDTYCDRILVTVDLPVPEDKARTRATVLVTIDDYSVPVSDFDMFAYTSDADGARGTRVASSGNNPGDPETVSVPVVSLPGRTTHHVLVEVPYFAAAGSYEGSARLTGVASS